MRENQTLPPRPLDNSGVVLFGVWIFGHAAKKKLTSKGVPPMMIDGIKKPKLTDIYLSGNFNPCPCGYVYGEDELAILAEHFGKGHYEQSQEKEK